MLTPCCICLLFIDANHFFFFFLQTALLFAQAMSEKLPRAEGIPSEVRSWSDFAGGKHL